MGSSSLPATTNDVVPRHSPSWIESFINLTEGTHSPLIFRKWAAVSIITGALERKCWAQFNRRLCYPNTFILLCGPPGIGKTDAIREVFAFSESLSTLHLAPSNVSRASLVDSIAAARRALNEPPPLIFNSLVAAADEFGVFLSKYETEFMSILNKLFDGTPYTESKRGMKDDIKIDNPLLNIIAGTTPSWLSGALPDTAWAEGFSSRLIIIYSGEKVRIDPFADLVFSDDLRAALELDLKEIHSLRGQFLFDDDVVEVFRKWHAADCPPIPEHPRLEHYLPRRSVHFLKLAMAWSAARSNEMIIRMEDYQRAMDMFLEAEAHMPDLFRAMKSAGSDGAVIDECYAYVYQTYHKEGKGVAEPRILHFLSQRVPSHNVPRVLEIMIRSDILASDGVQGGRPTYKPAPKAPRS